MSPSVQRLPAWALAAGVVCALAVAAWAGWASLQRSTGQALFQGQQPLPGRIAGHDAPLPALATRCSNCHEAVSLLPVAAVGATTAAAASASAGATAGVNAGVNAGATAGASSSTSPSASRTFAMPLTAAWLAQPQRRRGGPPSRYDAAALCAALRSGVDPAHVIIATTMPHYDASDAQCRQLWAYLSSR